MKLFKKIIGVLIGTLIMGLGVAFFELSSLGFDGLSCVVVSLQELTSVTYSIGYLLVNLLFFILMIIFLRGQIGIGSVINYLLTGVFGDLFMFLFKVVGFSGSSIFILNLLFGLFGVICLALGIALYANANLGVTPYDALPLIITKYLKINKKPIKYHIARKMVDGACILFGLIVGIIILKQYHIFGINTVVTLIFVGYLVSFFSKLVNKYIYKTTSDTFN